MSNEFVRGRRRRSVADENYLNDWIEKEIAGCQFKDERLGKRFHTLLRQLSEGAGESIPMACQDWANTKAAYRFLSNERVDEHQILAGHFQATRARFSACAGIALVLHDTTELTFHRDDGREIGYLHRSTVRCRISSLRTGRFPQLGTT